MSRCAFATGLRQSELEGGNLRSLAASAVAKIEVLEADAGSRATALAQQEKDLKNRDARITELEESLYGAMVDVGEMEKLKGVIGELQQVLKEALKAGTWQQCRELLYHESLRYIPVSPANKSKPQQLARGRASGAY